MFVMQWAKIFGAEEVIVFDISDEDGSTTNYALSKKNFIEKVVKDESKKIDYHAFSLILDKIEEIDNL